MLKIAEKKRTVLDIRAAKNAAEPFLALTAYTAPIAMLADKVADMVLVGDSLGMVLYGMPNTLGVTLDMMITHGTAVARYCQRALCIIDMPFGSYQSSPSQAFDNAARVISQTGAQAVKLEGGEEMAETIKFLVERGIPVVGHIGLRPQLLHTMGGYRIQGKTDATHELLLRDAKAVEQAGAFAMVVEGVVETSAREVTESVSIPTIGIGASSACDAQILVSEDALGLTPLPRAKFVKAYAELRAQAEQALEQLAADVKARRFPGPEQTYVKK
ncbi:MAG: 3-methyl-2-oxobutanoate hydroxymethyltransferase [Proteobacteria bacterium]|nr:3-methyl-2-oxobutanoate hydroxymethyltransferase [Pseudomonadota bacterium]